MNLETLRACPLCESDNLRVLDTYANICVCDPCGYVFDNPRPTLGELISFYSQPAKYDPWLDEEEARDRLWERRLRLLLPVLKPGPLLDVGTGIGQSLNIARPHFSSVCGTEVSESAIHIAREKYGLNLTRGEIQAIDFKGAEFDNVTVFHVLEDVPNPKLLIEACARLLTPGGTLVIAVPNDVRSLKSKAKRLFGIVGVEKFRNVGKLGLPRLVLDGSIPEIHLSHFTPESLQRLVERCGFDTVWNTLDPYYAAKGFSNCKHRSFYEFCRWLEFVSRVNVYDTILMVARKRRAGLS